MAKQISFIVKITFYNLIRYSNHKFECTILKLTKWAEVFVGIKTEHIRVYQIATPNKYNYNYIDLPEVTRKSR